MVKQILTKIFVDKLSHEKYFQVSYIKVGLPKKKMYKILNLYINIDS